MVNALAEQAHFGGCVRVDFGAVPGKRLKVEEDGRIVKDLERVARNRRSDSLLKCVEAWQSLGAGKQKN